MKSSRIVKRVLAGAVVLTILGVCATTALSGHEDRQPTEGVATTIGSDWTLRLEPDATLHIDHKGSPVVAMDYRFWGPNWTYARTGFELKEGRDGNPVVVGAADGIKLQMIGLVDRPAADPLVIDFEVPTSSNFQPAVGGGLAWNLTLDSPTFDGRLPEPELIDGDAGWKLKTGPEQALTVRFEPALDKIYFAENRRNEIRTFLVPNSIRAGKSRIRMTVQLPEGARRALAVNERYGPADTRRWFRGALDWNASPVDLSFLNRDDRPAGRHGFVRAEGDQLVRGDGRPMRFWGGNLAGGALFLTPRENVANQAHRMAKLGFNLMRIHHHDSEWVQPNLFDRRYKDSRHLNARSFDNLDWWIKCLKDEGIYVWLDMNVGRIFKPADGIRPGFEEIARNAGGGEGFVYYNQSLQELMKEFQHNYLQHMNRYTGLRYRDDPAVMGVLVTNENDLTQHYGNAMLPDKNHPVHNAFWTKGYKDFAGNHRLPEGRVSQTWAPGPGKIYLNEAEHLFNRMMIDDLRGIGLKAPIATTNYWGEEPLYSLPALTDGDVIDVHSYGDSESMDINPRQRPNFVSWIAAGQVSGKPLTITEWNVEYPKTDRFTAPLYVASVAALQGWDAPMIYNYSQSALTPPNGLETWSTFSDLAITGVMPAAALIYRQAHVSPARTTYCLMLDKARLFDRELSPRTSATIRTLAEQSRLTIGMPEVKELPWLNPSKPPTDAIVVTDPDRDFIPENQSFVRSDTQELTRDWVQGIQTIDTPKTQAVGGWIGGKNLKTRDATIATSTRKAVIALSSVDNRPLNTSRFIMITTVARVVSSPGNQSPFLSEPVVSKISLQTENTVMQLLSLGKDGRVVDSSNLEREAGRLTVDLPTARGTHWYVLRARGGGDSAKDTTKGMSGRE